MSKSLVSFHGNIMLKYGTYGGWLRNPAPVDRSGGRHPIIYRVSTIQGDAGFLPSTVTRDNVG